jgi:hypothetical protein
MHVTGVMVRWSASEVARGGGNFWWDENGMGEVLRGKLRSRPHAVEPVGGHSKL